MPQQWPEQPYDIAYQSGNAYRSAPTLVKLAAIFNFVMAGIDFVYGLCLIVGTIIFAVLPDDPGDPPHWIIATIMAAITVLPFAAASLKLTAGLKLIRFGKSAGGWGLAAGIFGCTQLWCSYFCVLPLACGVFTIVVVCLENVRAYLRDSCAARMQNAAT
jgi:hypothetical protein